jgi:sugar phosphate isomerase/epimerase
MIGICAPFSMLNKMLELGFEFVEIRCDEISQIKYSSNSCFCANSFIPKDKPLFMEEEKFEASLKYCRELLLKCNDKGIRHITLGSGCSRKITGLIDQSKIFDRWSRFLRIVDLEAYRNDITIGLEPLVKSESNFLNTYKEAQYWIKYLSLKSFGITFDTFHFEQEENNLDEILKSCPHYITHIHISGLNQNFPQSINDISPRLMNFIKNNLNNYPISVEPVPFKINNINTKTLQELLIWRK